MAVSKVDPSLYATIGLLVRNVRRQHFRTRLALVFILVMKYCSVGHRKQYHDKHANRALSKVRAPMSSILTYKERLRLLVLRNFGPSFVGYSQVLKIPPCGLINITSKRAKLITTYEVSCHESYGDGSSTSIVWFGIIRNPSSNDWYSCINSTGH